MYDNHVHSVSTRIVSKYGLGLITSKLDQRTRSSIVLSVVAINVDRIYRSLLRSIFDIILSRYSQHEFMLSSILSGITWDIIKGSPKLFQLYFLKKNSIDEEKLEEIIDRIPLNEKKAKIVLKRSLKNNEEYQMLVMQIISKMQQSRRRKNLICLILIVVILVIGIRTMYNQKSLRIFSNEYIEVVYNGLKKGKYISDRGRGYIFL